MTRPTRAKMKMPIVPTSMLNAHGGPTPPAGSLNPAAAAPHVMRQNVRPATHASANLAILEKRPDLVRFLAVAETGRIGASA